MQTTLVSFALAIALVLTLPLPARAQDGDGLTPFIEGRVSRVVDGNTIILTDAGSGRQIRVLLRGTDAPELAQPHGAESRRRLESLVGGAQVRVEFQFTDRYGQVFGLVLRDGEDINFRLLEEGATWLRLQLANVLTTADKKAYEQAEREARAAGRGLWKDKSPVAPWEFRRAHNVSDDPRDEPPAALPAAPVAVEANRRTRLYFTPSCAGAARIPARQRTRFRDAAAAERAGYKLAPGCAQ